MALGNINNVKTTNISPAPIKDKIVVNQLPTITFIRYLNDLRASNGSVYKELNKIIDQVNLNTDEINLLRIDLDALFIIVDNLQEEVDRVEVGAGLDINGNYITPSGTNFIDTSTSLANADLLLDETLRDSQTKILNKSVSYQTLKENQLIIADATNGEINITLPKPSDSIINDVSYSIGITKSDSSNNKVIIKPFASELIVGETQQGLRYEGEVLNFITDGTNWHLGA